MDRIGWEIQGVFFPHQGADALRQGDFALMREVSGLTLDALDRGDDPLATNTAWMAVAVWQARPDMRRDQVVRFIEQLPLGAAEQVGWTDDVPLTEDGSPASGSSSNDTDSPPAASSSPSASTSTTKSPAESTPEALLPGFSGGQPSATGATSPPKISDPLTVVEG